jgi:hypothetical protein
MLINSPIVLTFTKKAAGNDIARSVTIGIHQSKFINPQITTDQEAIVAINDVIVMNKFVACIAGTAERILIKLTLASIITNKIIM